MSQTPPTSTVGTTRPGRPGRHRWGFLLAVALLIAVPIAEIWLLVQVGDRIGFLPTLLILVAEAVLGAWLMRREGAKAWTALTTAYGSGRLPSGELADAALVLVGGALLMLPGFVTDLLGLLFLLPFTRPLARKAMAFLIARRVASMGFAPGAGRPTVIPGETVKPPTPTTDDPRIIRGEVEG